MSSDCCEIKPINIDIEVNQHNVEVEVNQHNVEMISGGVYTFNFNGSYDSELLEITQFDQRIFVLSNTMVMSANSMLFLNGLKQRYGYDYVFDSSIKTLTYLNRDDLPLELDDELEVYYY